MVTLAHSACYQYGIILVGFYGPVKVGVRPRYGSAPEKAAIPCIRRPVLRRDRRRLWIFRPVDEGGKFRFVNRRGRIRQTSLPPAFPHPICHQSAVRSTRLVYSPTIRRPRR